jgi:hypothetical protein
MRRRLILCQWTEAWVAGCCGRRGFPDRRSMEVILGVNASRDWGGRWVLGAWSGRHGANHGVLVLREFWGVFLAVFWEIWGGFLVLTDTQNTLEFGAFAEVFRVWSFMVKILCVGTHRLDSRVGIQMVKKDSSFPLIHAREGRHTRHTKHSICQREIKKILTRRVAIYARVRCRGPPAYILIQDQNHHMTRNRSSCMTDCHPTQMKLCIRCQRHYYPHSGRQLRCDVCRLPVKTPTRLCEECTRPFPANRRDQRFCTAGCRSANYNRMHDIPGYLRNLRKSQLLDSAD